MKIAGFYEEAGDDVNGGYSNKWGKRFLGIGNPIRIYDHPVTGSCLQTFGTTIHELAHAAHWTRVGNDIKDYDIIVAESWARGVERYLANKITIYPTGNQMSRYSRGKYTGIVEDLVDGIKTTTSQYYYSASYGKVMENSEKYNDNVSGYTMKQIEDALVESKTWEEWKSKIKTKYNNETENNLDAAFNFWGNK